jgi:hypothetical protein
MTIEPRGLLPKVDPIVRADRLMNVSFLRIDTEAMGRYLVDFGFVVASKLDDTTYYRGYGLDAWLVSVTKSDRDAFIGFSMAASSREDLERLAAQTGAAIEPDERPGGGSRIRLIDPNGTPVDLIHGSAAADPLPTRLSEVPFNTPLKKRRVNETVRPPLVPAPIFKLGHVVFQCRDFETVATWYARHFGFLPTDLLTVADGGPALGFFRFDRGNQPSDHHSLALLDGAETKMLHVSFETFDLESVGQGNQVLKAGGHRHYWGLGRHALGSQIFDYWKDPAGDEWEHYADGDVMTADFPTGYHTLDRQGLWTWGDDLPPDMRPDITGEDAARLHGQGAFGDKDVNRIIGLIDALRVSPRPWMQ